MGRHSATAALAKAGRGRPVTIKMRAAVNGMFYLTFLNRLAPA
jgi:hypothetical protein